MNLSNITRVALIPNFNPKRGYPQFAYKGKPEVVKAPVIIAEKSVKVLSDQQVFDIKALKEAKKAFKQSANSKRKPIIAVSNKLN